MPDIPRSRDRLNLSDPVQSQMVSTISYNRLYDYQTMDDVVTSRFRERVAGGEIIINPLTFESTKHELFDDSVSWEKIPTSELIELPHSGSAHIMRSGIGYAPQGSTQFDSPLPLDESDLLDLQMQKSLAFVDRPQYDFGEDLAEIVETIQFLWSPLKSISKLLTAFDKKAAKIVSRKGKVLDAAKKAEAIAGVWATYSFALAPLMRSVEEGIKALNDKSILQLRRTSRSKDRVTDTKVSEHEGIYGGSTFFKVPSYTCKAVLTESHSVDYHVGIIYDAPQRGDLLSKLGFRGKDLVTTAWEIIPMSFMLDRIINVKNALSGAINLIDPNVKVKGAFVMKREVIRNIWSLTDFTITRPDFELRSFATAPHFSEKFIMTREKWNPTFAVTLPLYNPIELVNSVSKIADLTSLLTLQLGPLLRKYYV